MVCFNKDCPCCIIKSSRLCCDTCNPGSFILPLPMTSAPKQTQAPNKFKVGQFELTDADLRLKTALQDWRRNQLLSTIGDDNTFRSQLIMTNDVLERLVGLAHFKQVSNLASIHTQVSWQYSDLWGTHILDIIKKHFPASIDHASSIPVLQPAKNLLGSSAVHRPSNDLSTTTVHSSSHDPKPPRARRCSACGSGTHIGM